MRRATYNDDVDFLLLSKARVRCLKWNGLWKIGQLTRLSKAELERGHRIGPDFAADVAAAMIEAGLALGCGVPDELRQDFPLPELFR